MKFLPAAATFLFSVAAGSCGKKDPHILVFKCQQGSTISARLGYNGKDQVLLQLGDGRAMTLPHRPWPWGLRYATRDNQIVFIVKSRDAMFEEDGERPFGSCSAA